MFYQPGNYCLLSMRSMFYRPEVHVPLVYRLTVSITSASVNALAIYLCIPQLHVGAPISIYSLGLTQVSYTR